MALQTNYTDPNSGLTLTNAYLVLGRYTGDGPALNGTLLVYVSSATYQAGNAPVFQTTFSIPDATQLTQVTTQANAFLNLLASVYAYLAAQPQFAGSTVVA